eukprot:TRINITY_DN167_c0_g1_i1.p2 TRINITY_DN167_c0_g1~~TRINITY_DN167_c0_g1_i1.p2  ORF type:complete len:582 (+),score=135.94 TRINITY_DN167_c0_g1_i1:1589-3334(+)
MCPSLVENELCNPHACDVDCEVSEWSSWSDCDATCGGGSQTRTRTITVDPVGNGAACPDLSETQSCNTDPCPIHCVVSEWSDWGTCSVPCGTGIRARTRTVLVDPQFGGTSCPQLIEQEVCNTHVCDVDCQVSEWGDWSACDAMCDGGSQTRTRTITVDPVGNGAACPVLSETQSCNTDPCGCPVPRVRKAWSLLSCAERDQYISAVTTFRNDFRDDYDKLTAMHVNAGIYMNQNNKFLPWNRAHILGWENMLRSLGGEYECITVPYWDSEKDAENEPLSPVFSSTTFGSWGAVETDPATRGCVTDGLAATWDDNIFYPCVTRDFPAGYTFTGQPGVVSMIIDHPIYNNFRPSIEMGQNAAVHSALGGTMATFAASEDPLYFVHHCNVDRLYALWQDYHGYDTIDRAALTDTHYSPISGADEVLELKYDGVIDFAPWYSHGWTIRDMFHINDMPGVNGENNYVYGDDNAAGILGSPVSGTWDLVTPVLNQPTVSCTTSREVSVKSAVDSRCSFASDTISQICLAKIAAEPGISNYDLFNYLTKVECDTFGNVAVSQEWIDLMGITPNMLKYTKPCWYQDGL